MEKGLFEVSEKIKNGKIKRIKLLGDSITHGVGGTGFCQNGEFITEDFARNKDGFCWAKLFKDYLCDKYDCEVVNNGCTGTNIEYVINNLDKLLDEQDELVICMIGTNNRHQYKGALPKKTREEMANAFYFNVLKLNEMIAKKVKDVIFMANIPASAQNESDGIDSGGNFYWRILHMNDINAIYKKAQQKAGFMFISMYDLLSEYISNFGVKIEDLLGDGLHPNDKGYQIMFELLKKELSI